MKPTQRNIVASHFFLAKGKGKRGSRRVRVLRPKVDLRRLWTPEIQRRGFILNRALSRFFRRFFENPKIRTLVGAQLAILTLLTGVIRAVPAMAFGIVPNVGLAALTREVDLTTKATVVAPMERYELTQGFSIFHPGIDLAADIGTPVHPMMNGVVTEAGWSFFGYGNTVYVDHQNGYGSRYAHLSKLLVHEGDKVATETTLGLSGNTGRATGPHLHLEIHDHGIPINPRTLLE